MDSGSRREFEAGQVAACMGPAGLAVVSGRCEPVCIFGGLKFSCHTRVSAAPAE
jgi:hypothetical protein